MIFLSAAVSLFVYCLFLVVCEPFLGNYQKVSTRLRNLEDSGIEIGNEELARPFSERVVKPLLAKLLKGVTKLSGQKNIGALKKQEKDLRQAGISMPAGEFIALKNIILFICAGTGIASLFLPGINAQMKLLILLFLLLLGILIPRYYVSGKAKKRLNEIRSQMPDIMDLLSVSVEAGLGFDAALLRVGERSKGALMEELLGVYREVQMGKPRKEAFKDLGERCSLEELKTFAGAMVQAEQLGIPIKNVLFLQAQQLRLKRRQSAEEKAMKAPVKMMLPLVAFIFPVLFIILLGPSVIKIIQVFRS